MNSKINGKVWQDLNGNGFQDSFELGIADWTVYLDENQNGQLDVGEYSTLTNEDGEYTFLGLESGTYTVAQTVLPGWQQLSPHPNANKERLFAIPDDGYNQIVELNPLTGTELYRFEVPTWINGRTDSLAFNGTSLFLTNGSDQLWELDPNTGAVINDYWVDIGGDFEGLATLGSKVYLLDSSDSDIIEFDPIREEVTTVLDIDPINSGFHSRVGLSGDHASNVLWVTDQDERYVFKIDPGTGQEMQSFFTYSRTHYMSAAVIGGEIYLGSDYTSEINIFDQKGGLPRTLDLPYRVSALAGDGLKNSLPSLTKESNDTLSHAVVSGLSETNPIFTDSGLIGDNSLVDSWLDVDLIAFQLDEGQEVTIDVDDWTALRLFDDQGQEVRYHYNDEPWNPYTSINFQALSTGTYYVGISGSNNWQYDPLVPGSGNGYESWGSTGGYNIKIALTQDKEPNEPNNTIYQAIATGLSSANPGTFKETGFIGDHINNPPWSNSNQSDVDFYKVQLNLGERVRIDIDAEQFGSYLDAELRLFDSRGNEVASSDADAAPGEAYSGRDPYIDFIASRDDTYYIGVSHSGNYYDPFVATMDYGYGYSGGYNLEVTVGDDPVSEGGERLFATPLDRSNQIVELNPLTGEEINRFAIPRWANNAVGGLAYNGQSVFFTDGSNCLWELNPSTGEVIDFDQVFTENTSIDDLAVLGNKVYLLDDQGKDIIEFDSISDQVTNILNIDALNPTITRVGGLGVRRNPDQLLVTNGNDQLFVINPTTGLISDTLFTDTTDNTGIAFVNGELLVNSFRGNQEINVLDNSGNVQRTISLPYDVSALGGDGFHYGLNSLSYESNDTITQAVYSGLSRTNPGTFTDMGMIGDNPAVNLGADVDLIALQLNQGQWVTIDLDVETFEPNLDAALRLFDSNGQEVVFSLYGSAPGESGFSEPYIEFEALYSDTYYVGISSASNVDYDPFVLGSGSSDNSWNDTGVYAVNITLEDYRGVNEPNDILSQAIATGLTSITPGVFTDTGIIGDYWNPYNTNFIPGSDVDFYKVELSRGERITVDIDAETVGSELDAKLRLFDFRGREVAESESDLAPRETGFSDDPYIDFTAFEAGTYYIGVSSEGSWYDPTIANYRDYSYSSSGGYNIKIGVGNYSEIPGTHTVILDPGQNVEEVDFINRLVIPPTITVDDVTLTEGNNGSKYANFTVSLSDAYSEVVTVDYSTSDQSAIAGEDYRATNGTLAFFPGETSQTVTVEIFGDTDIETDESLVLNLSNPSHGAIADSQGTVTIENNDFPTLSIENISLTEGNSGITTAEFTVNLSQAFHETVTVDYTTADNSAMADSDYTAINGTLTFAPGQTSQTINVDVLGDTAFEDDETFALNLSNAQNATLDNSQGVATIVKDDFPTELNITTDEVTNSYALTSYAGNQDKNALVNFTWDGNEVGITGNGWKKLPLNQTINKGTILEFEFKSTAEGEIQGIGFDTDDSLSSKQFFKLYGTQNFGIKHFNNYADSAGEWKSYRIDVGNFLTGKMDYLVFANDHDVKDPTASSQFRNIQFYDPELAVTANGITDTYTLDSYAGNQDKRAIVTLSEDSREVQLEGNGWKKVALNQTINKGTILEFEFKSTAAGEVQGIGFDTDDSLSSKQFFKLYGTQNFGIKHFNNYADSAGEWKSYRIDVGNFFTGEMDYLFFANDHDVKNPTASSQFRNIKLYDPELAVTANGITDTYTLDAYAGNQDKRAIVTLSEDSREVQLEGNGWKKLGLDYTITADTILEFDFKSTAEGEIQGIGFDSDNRLSSNQFFKLYGTQSWGIKDFNNYSDTAGEWQSYQIRVGDFFTGQMNYLILGNDHDVKNPNAASQFRNIQVYEQSATDEITGTDPSVGEVDTLTGTANVDTFILGDVTGALSADNGVDDYALIMDFDASQDMIQLAGNAADYQLMATSGSLPEGMGIYQDLGTSDELIGIVQTVDSLSLESSAFSFV
ncbi:MAG: pre-peptidase C-terminal domain-containing protein [Coleofasciculus sp. C1-SOL-03]|uniref:Calx-beta domain-containing protein n=1 Tax=Coleofasciculus sp. C1-SOL-03 TaxID=3069522 RepID=UPI0032F4BEF6